MIDPASIAVGLVVGAGSGVIGFALYFSNSERLRAELELARRRISSLYQTNKELIKHGHDLELANDLLLTEKTRRDAPLKAANAARHAKAEAARHERMELSAARLSIDVPARLTGETV